MPSPRPGSLRPLSVLGLAGLLALGAAGCAGTRPESLAVRTGRLAPCPASPNCVSSDATDPTHHVAPLRLRTDAASAWPVIREVLAGWPRTAITGETPDALHAECTSAWLGFVDDLELQARPDEGVIAVRSASRLGYSDLGVNRRRVEALRDALVQRGVVLGP